jgi:hypothetical protein
MATPNRPKRVVVVDAENPLVEVQGEFFWREDHEALVAAAREEAYRGGYQSGWADAARQAAPQAGQQVIEFRRRRSVFAQLRRIVLGLVLLYMFLIVVVTVVEQFFAAR